MSSNGSGHRTEASAGDTTHPKLVLYFAPDFTEVSTVTRARGFLDHGFRLAVVAFRRGRYNPYFTPPWRQVELGHTVDGRYLHRAVKLFLALSVLWHNRALLGEASVLHARNMDLLLLAFLCRLFLARRARLVYEVLDVASAFTRRGPAAAAMRFVERRLLGAIDALVISSPAFHSLHYLPVQGYRGPTFVIENRLHPSAVAVIERSAGASASELQARRRYKWVIGYFGLIRGERTFDLITRLAERFPDILFYFRGVVTTVGAQKFATVIARHENMVHGGAYVNPDDLKQCYGLVDFTWALDLEHEDHNSRWLMPCRFYESGLIGVPCLAARGFEVGERIDVLGIGWTLAPDYEDSFARLFARLTRAEYQAVVDRLVALPVRTFVTGEDMAAFCRAMTGGQASAPPSSGPAPPIRLAPPVVDPPAGAPLSDAAVARAPGAPAVADLPRANSLPAA